MNQSFERTRLLVGDEGLERLANATVVLFGLGGVGSYAAEAIARAGVGHVVLIDSDCVEMTNLNRQLLALNTTIGRPKVEVSGIRVADISVTVNCPLARRIRQRLRKEGITQGIRCVYSEAQPLPHIAPQGDNNGVRGTISYLPGLVGLTAAGVIINDILAVNA